VATHLDGSPCPGVYACQRCRVERALTGNSYLVIDRRPGLSPIAYSHLPWWKRLLMRRG
jgi:hypothetical protein